MIHSWNTLRSAINDRRRRCDNDLFRDHIELAREILIRHRLYERVFIAFNEVMQQTNVLD